MSAQPKRLTVCRTCLLAPTAAWRPASRGSSRGVAIGESAAGDLVAEIGFLTGLVVILVIRLAGICAAARPTRAAAAAHPAMAHLPGLHELTLLRCLDERPRVVS